MYIITKWVNLCIIKYIYNIYIYILYNNHHNLIENQLVSQQVKSPTYPFAFLGFNLYSREVLPAASSPTTRTWCNTGKRCACPNWGWMSHSPIFARWINCCNDSRSKCSQDVWVDYPPGFLMFGFKKRFIHHIHHPSFGQPNSWDSTGKMMQKNVGPFGLMKRLNHYNHRYPLVN